MTGAAVLVSRGALIKAIGFGGNVVLARLLVPKDFGLIAFGTTIMFMTNFIVYEGMDPRSCAGSNPRPG